MASSFTITSNHSLRMIYAGNLNVIKRADRENQSASKLNAADSKALVRGLDSLKNLDMDSLDKENENHQKKFYNTTKAFADAYNYTIESGSASTNSSIRKITDRIKKLSSQYADEMKDYGITFSKDGYMSLKESTLKSMSASNYTDVIGKDSEFNTELTKLARQLGRHIDVAV